MNIKVTWAQYKYKWPQLHCGTGTEKNYNYYLLKYDTEKCPISFEGGGGIDSASSLSDKMQNNELNCKKENIP